MSKTPTLLVLIPDPVLERPQCNSQAIEKEVAAVTIAPWRPKVVDREGSSAGWDADATSEADV